MVLNALSPDWAEAAAHDDLAPPLRDWGAELWQAHHGSAAQVVGLFTQDGTPAYLNRGMTAVLGGDAPDRPRRDYLVNPSFPQLLDCPGDGLIFSGLLTLGDGYRLLRTLCCQVYRRGGHLLIVGEYDVVELDRQERELSRTNQEVNNLQRELIHRNADLGQALAEVQQQLQTLRDSEQRLRRIVEHIADPVMVTDLTASIRTVNPAFTRVTGYAPMEVLGRTPKLLASAHHPPAFYAEMRRQLHEDGRWLGNIWNRRKNGELYVQRLAISRLRDSANEGLYVAVYNDIDQEIRALERAQFQAQHDALTGLPNRVLLFDRLSEALLSARRYGDQVAVLFIDLDHFKPINDRHGHAVGDVVLQTVAHRLGQSVRETDTVARLGGDEFVVVLREVQVPDAAMLVAGKILASLSPPMVVDGIDLFVAASIGIAFGPVAGEDASDLLHRADTAMYAAKHDRSAPLHIVVSG